MLTDTMVLAWFFDDNNYSKPSPSDDRGQKVYTWQLERYNEWDLPFASEIEIGGRYQGGDLSEYDGSYPYVLPKRLYKMEVDPSALFSILFIEKDRFAQYDESALVNLNYTFLGD